MGGKMGFRNDSGTISAIPYAILTLIIVGLILVAFGLVLDIVIDTDNAMLISQSSPYSEQRQDTMAFLEMCWRALAFVATFCVVIFLVMNGQQGQTGGI